MGKRKEEIRGEIERVNKRNDLIFKLIALGNIAAILTLGVVYMV